MESSKDFRARVLVEWSCMSYSRLSLSTGPSRPTAKLVVLVWDPKLNWKKELRLYFFNTKLAQNIVFHCFLVVWFCFPACCRMICLLSWPIAPKKGVEAGNRDRPGTEETSNGCEHEKNRLSKDSFRETAHLIRGWGNKGYLNLWGWGRGFQGESISLAWAKVQGNPYLYKEKFQVLLGMTL